VGTLGVSDLEAPQSGSRVRSDVRPTEFIDAIRATVEEFGLRSAEIHVVSSVQEWALQHGMEELEPFRAARAAVSPLGAPAIVLLECISIDIQDSILSRLAVGGFAQQADQLSVPHAFIEHLVLHEVAHLLLPRDASEEDCDKWAFERLTGGWSRRAA
jgi:hypothetical protein